MNELDPFLRYLGIEETADAVTLLGLQDTQITSATIEQALRKQLARVYGHPDGRSTSAERVKRSLRKAADELRQPLERQRVAALPRNGSAPTRRADAMSRPDFSQRPKPRLELTEFDRQVIATLVSCGGWNARSRTRLVGLSAAHNVSVDGLVTVLTGLSEFGRAGGGHLEVSDITPSRPAVMVQPRRAPGELARAAAKAAERLTPEFKEQSPWATIKLSALFGLITIIVGVLFLRTLIFTGAPPARTTQPDPVAVAPPVQSGSTANARSGRTAVDPSDRYGKLVQFQSPPTFVGNAMPARVMTAADQTVDLPAHFDEIERRLTVLTGEPSEALLQNWRVSTHTIALSWPHVQRTVNGRINDAILDALHEASSRPSLVDQLLADMIPGSSLSTPEDINIGAWNAGMLAQIAASRLPPVITDQARRLVASGPYEQPASASVPFRDHARAWLDSIAATLIERAHYEERFEDYWETWLTAQTALISSGIRPDQHGFDDALLRVIERILRSGADLTNPGPAVNLVARLLNQLSFETNPQIRDRFLSWFDDESVTLDDLWALTSLMATYNRRTTWFSTDLVLLAAVPDHDSASRYRSRARDRIRDTWPKVGPAEESSIRAAGSGIPVDPVVVERWRELAMVLNGLIPTDDPDELVRRLGLAASMNTGAALLTAGEPAEAAALLDQLTTLIAPPAPESASDPNAGQRAGQGQQIVTLRSSNRQQQGTRPGQAIGSDGQWAAEFESARTTEDKLALLTQLRNGAGTDLGRLDALAFVQQVYRGSPVEVRSLAQQVLLERFLDGPQVALQMLDQVMDAPATRGTIDVLEQYTGTTLPERQTRAWDIAARLALVRNALRLHDSEEASLNEAQQALSITYDGQLLALAAGEVTLASTGSAEQSLARLHEHLRRRASALVPTEQVPASLVGLARRHEIRQRLAAGSIQHFVAQQLGLLELLAYITVAEQPTLADHVRSLLVDSARLRLAHRHVLQQALEAELLLGRLWNLRMAGDAVARVEFAEPRLQGLPTLQHALIDMLAQSLLMSPSYALLPTADVDWTDRLEQLRPAQPLAYFELAEEVADLASSDADVALARRLFSLAGVLDPDHLGRSACLALADLEEDALTKRRLLALAALLDRRATAVITERVATADVLAQPEAVIAVVDALSHHREGSGSRAQTALRTEGADDLLQSLDAALPGGSRRILDDIRLYRAGQPPRIFDDQDIAILRIQAGLLAGDQRSWQADLLLEDGRPLIEVDPDDLPATFGHDASLPVYRSGRWRSVE